MESGQLALAQQRLQKAQALNPNGVLTLKAAKNGSNCNSLNHNHQSIQVI
jgi:hypothetical protein